VRQADKLLITFERLSPAKSLITSFKKGNSMGSAKILAAYMAIQYVQSSFSLPDLVTAVPSTRFRKWQALGASAEMLAAELAAILQSPYVSTLKRKRQLLRQDFLDREQRLCLSSDDFVLKSEVSVKGKVVLLVDDTITTGSTLQCCAEHLWQASSRKVIKMACLDQGYLKD
jgi:ComF family protein